MSSPYPHEEELFAAALTLPVEERAAFLQRECGDDDALRRRVEALLRAHERAGGFLESPPMADLAEEIRPPPPADVVVGTQIDHYKLLEKLGEGGCGVVYLAEQEEPVRRRVALKVIRLGMDTREVIARFEAERQALALMDHPNIAKVLDAGTTDAGRPYFVMELVRGVKITTYCDQHHLTTAERLRLFAQVCHAIQHAHQKGVIHRDIKPANILVTLQDGAPVPKVIDFGIAKATQGRLTDQTLYTAFEQFIGTPAYMSPEQAELSSQDVDTRSDIYSLGVLLYELLTGHTPFETKELLKAGLDEMRRRIRETEPPKPSTRLRTLDGPTLDTTAQHRATEPPKLIHLVRGDLDWIVMCCLEKNRTRRYETAEALALDVDHNLHDEPVRARPPSEWYRLCKLVRRNKLTFAAIGVVTVVLLLGLAATTGMFVREKAARERAVAAERLQAQLHQQADADRARAITAEEEQRQLRQNANAALQRAIAAETEQNRQRQQAERARATEAKERALAEAARASEEKQRMRAEAERKRAETETGKSRQIVRFLSDMLQSVGPSVALGRDSTLLREILDKTATRIGTELKGQPEAQAELRQVVGKIYRAIGQLNKAEAMLRASLALQKRIHGEDDPTVAAALFSLSGLLAERNKYAEAEALVRESLVIRRKLFGNENLAVAQSLLGLAGVSSDRGDSPTAERYARQALAIRRKLLGVEHPDVADSMSMLAGIMFRRGELAQAGLLFHDALAIQLKAFGHDHPEVANSLIGEGAVAFLQGDRTGAEAKFREALSIQRNLYGTEYPSEDTAMALNCLGAIRATRLDYAGAESAFRKALEIQRRLYGSEHRDIAISLANLAETVAARGDPVAAEPLAREAVAMERKILGDQHPDLAESLVVLAKILAKRGDRPGAETRYLEAWRILGHQSPGRNDVRWDVAKSLVDLYTPWAQTDPTKKPAAAEWMKRLGSLKEPVTPKARVPSDTGGNP